MGLLDFAFLFLACGAATFPLTIVLLRGVVSVAAPSRATPRFHDALDKATGWSVAAWIAGVLIFYAALVLIERQKPCEDQRTNQLTAACKKYLIELKPK